MAIAISNNPLPSHRELGNRLAGMRRLRGWSQEALAARVHSTRDQIANVESGRRELTFGIGWEICRVLDIDQLYLAIGEPPESPFHDISLKDGDYDLPPTRGFHEMVARWLWNELELRRKARKETAKTPAPASSFEQTVSLIIRSSLELVRKEDRFRFLSDLAAWVHLFVNEETSATSLLTNVSEYANNVPMSSPMATLLQRLKKATAMRGKKSELAKALKVPLTSVSQWLSGEREPSGETTLKLLQWVEQQERKH